MADPDVTERSFPFASGQGENVTEDDWSAMASTWQDRGVAFGLTVEPGPTENTIQLNEGQAAIDGFVYRLTAPKVIPIGANGNTVNRIDLVVLRLDKTNEEIVVVVRTSTPLSALGPMEIPLSSWTQLPSTVATSSNWGSATDVRWFQGARMRPALANAQPPATLGAFMYLPEEGGQGSVYIGADDGAGGVEWVEWAPGTESVNAAISAAVSQRVSTAGGSVIQIPNGDTTTKALQVRVPAGDRTASNAVNTLELQYNTGSDASPTWTTTSYFNEFGEFRVQSSAASRVAARIKANVGQTANLFEVADSSNTNVLMSVSANGTVTAPNVGGARIYSGSTAPSSPKVGDVWVQF